MSEQDTGRGEAAPGNTAPFDASRGEADPGDTAPTDASGGEVVLEGTVPAQSSQTGPLVKETRDEARPTLDGAILVQDCPSLSEALLEQSVKRLEAHNANSDWGSEAPSIMGSSYYSIEDEGFQADLPKSLSVEIHETAFPQSTASARTDDEGHVPEVTDNVRVRVKFVLREGDGWVDQKDLSIDPSDPSQIEHVAEEHARNRRFLFNTISRFMAPPNASKPSSVTAPTLYF